MSELTEVAEAIRTGDRFLLVTHENADGDALGSILAAKLALERLGKDVVMFLGGDTGIPQEYAFMPLDDLRRELPADASGRTLVALDCASAQRTGLDEETLRSAPVSVNVDHHHDNTRFAQVNLILPEASSTGEIVRDLLRELGVELTPEIAEALYVAVVTDTGRFQYTNTTPKALRIAAELVEAARRSAGPDEATVIAAAFTGRPIEELRALARAVTGQDRCVVIFATEPDRRMIVARSPLLTVDASVILREALSEHNGRGGGKPEAAEGMAASAPSASVLVDAARDAARRHLAAHA